MEYFHMSFSMPCFFSFLSHRRTWKKFKECRSQLTYLLCLLICTFRLRFLWRHQTGQLYPLGG